MDNTEEIPHYVSREKGENFYISVQDIIIHSNTCHNRILGYSLIFSDLGFCEGVENKSTGIFS
jgi:hypothetical protein